jgi:type IV pilus assembly protein PilO
MRDAILEMVRRKMRLLIAIALLALLTVALFIVVDGYQVPRIAAAQMKWSDLRRQVAVSGRGDITNTYKQGKIDLETLRGRIPPKRQFPRLLGDILEQAVSSGVTTGPITYKPRVIKDEGLMAYELAMSVNGRYAAIKSFLADLRKFRELVVVDDFSLINSDVFEENVTMDLHVTIYLREDA